MRGVLKRNREVTKNYVVFRNFVLVNESARAWRTLGRLRFHLSDRSIEVSQRFFYCQRVHLPPQPLA